MFNAEEYTISVRKERMDGEVYWVARVEELSDIMEFGDSREEAYTLAIDTITVAQEMCISEGTRFPEPKVFVEQSASGRVTLRLPKSVHGNCISIAEAEGVSLNTYILTCITSYRSSSDVKVMDIDHITPEWEAALLHLRKAYSHPVQKLDFKFAVETQSVISNVSFRDKTNDLPLSCAEVAASFQRVKFHA